MSHGWREGEGEGGEGAGRGHCLLAIGKDVAGMGRLHGLSINSIQSTKR